MSRILGALLLLGAVAFGQTTVPVPIEQEPFHKEILRNARVRVLRVEIPAHETTRLHRHDRDYLPVALTDAHLTNAVSGKAPVEEKVRLGEVRLTKGGFAHAVRNQGASAVRFTAVEFLEPQGESKPSREPRSRYCNPGSKTACVTEDYLFCTAKLCVSDVTFGPGAVSTRHSHSTDHVLLAVSDYELTDQVEGKGKVVRSVKSGGVEYISAGITHQLTNTGTAPARFIVVVFR